MIARVTTSCAVLALTASTVGHAAECSTAGEESVTVAAIEPGLELRLTDRRLVRLVGLDPAGSTPAATDPGEVARIALGRLVAGRTITLHLMSGAPDRWGRLPAFAFRADTLEEGGLADAAIAVGLGRYRAEPTASACRDAFLASEAKARQAKLGLWGDPYYSVLAVDDQAAFAERSGTFVITEARLASVESGPYRTKLHFAAQGSYGRRLLTASILPHVLKSFEARGVTFEPLIGRTLRLRGLLDLRFGPQIELTNPRRTRSRRHLCGVIRAMRRAWGRLPAVAAVVAILAATGCATIDNQGVQVEPIEAPAAPKVITETTSSAEHKRMVALFGGEYKKASVETYLNDVLTKFATTNELEGRTYKVTILNTPIVNAFALPSGDIFVTRGLLALANDGSEVAAVMAHEIAHVTAKHAIAREEREKRAAVISRVAHLVQNKQRGDEIEAMGKMSIAGFSRAQELEADKIGITTIAKAGYDPYGASRFLAALQRSTTLRASLIGQNSTSAKPDILATHPSTPERVDAAVKVARGFGAPDIGKRDRDAYLTAIDGLMFGDDPAEGTIRGHKFTQPKLGFTFTAPDGFVLENSTQAVLGVKEGGAEALRLDSVAVDKGQALDTYVKSGWIDGLIESSIEKITVNGLPAVTATARAGEWNFRLAAIQFDEGEVYRMIFATHALDTAHEADYRKSIDTFRRIDPAEAESVKPLHVGIVTAKAGDTAATFSNRMVVPDKPLETFELLNGLQDSAPLEPGQRYKLVTE